MEEIEACLRSIAPYATVATLPWGLPYTHRIRSHVIDRRVKIGLIHHQVYLLISVEGSVEHAYVIADEKLETVDPEWACQVARSAMRAADILERVRERYGLD